MPLSKEGTTVGVSTATASVVLAISAITTWISGWSSENWSAICAEPVTAKIIVSQPATSTN